MLKSLTTEESLVNDHIQCLNGQGKAFLHISQAVDTQLTHPSQDGD